MKKNARALRALVLFAVCTGAGYGIGALLGKFMKTGGPKGDPLDWWGLAALPLIMVSVLAWHEFGHVLGGWSAGFVTWLYVVGPLRLERENGRLRAHWNRDWALAGGLAAMAPAEGQHPAAETLRMKMLRTTAGGPLASLAMALLAPLGVIVKSESRTLAFVLICMGLMSLAIAVATLLPHRSSGFVSDGARVAQLLRGGDASRLWCALSLAGSLALTMRPRLWPVAAVDGLRRKGEPHDEVMSRWMLHSWHMDREEWEEAERALTEALEGSSKLAPALGGLIHGSAAVHYALRQKPEAARAHLEQTRCTTFLKAGDRSAMEALVLAAEGRREEAQRLAQTAEAQLRGRPEVQAELYRELLERVRGQAARAELA
jgi:hypothetical protein